MQPHFETPCVLRHSWLAASNPPISTRVRQVLQFLCNCATIQCNPFPHASVAERKNFVDCKMHVPVLVKYKFVRQVSMWRQLPLCSSRQYHLQFRSDSIPAECHWSQNGPCTPLLRRLDEAALCRTEARLLLSALLLSASVMSTNSCVYSVDSCAHGIWRWYHQHRLSSDMRSVSSNMLQFSWERADGKSSEGDLVRIFEKTPRDQVFSPCVCSQILEFWCPSSLQYLHRVFPRFSIFSASRLMWFSDPAQNLLFSLNMPMCGTKQAVSFFPKHPMVQYLNSHHAFFNPTGESETAYGAACDS